MADDEVEAAGVREDDQVPGQAWVAARLRMQDIVYFKGQAAHTNTHTHTHSGTCGHLYYGSGHLFLFALGKC